MKSTQNYRFFNWARNESCTPKNYFQPDNEEDLIEIIKAHPKIRVTGTGHSWNKICITDEAMINMDKFNQVLDLEKGKLQVKVQPGIKLWQLNEFLDRQGLALQNLGSISYQSVAGAISTGTHGTGINYQILGSQVEEFWIIKADGENHRPLFYRPTV